MNQVDSRVLIVENDRRLAAQLQDMALKAARKVDVAHDLSTAYALIAANIPDVVMLDRVLDDGDGIELLEYIRDEQLPTRVMLISQLSSANERVSGLESGADDYVPKPFFASECLLRLKRLLRTSSQIEDDAVIEIGPFSINTKSGTVKIDDFQTQLRKKELQILTALARRANTVVNRETIKIAVWGHTHSAPIDATLDVYIRRIRMKLGIHATHLVTMRGFGYQLRV